MGSKIMKEKDQAVHNKKLNKWMKPLLITTGTVVFVLLLCLFFLYSRSFTIQYQPKTIAQFWSENNLENKFITNGNKIEIVVPDEVMNTEVMLLMQKMHYPSFFHVDGIQVDAIEERINLNTRVYGIKFPFSLSFHLELQEDQIVAEFGDMIIGDKGLKLSKESSRKIIESFFGSTTPINVDSKALLDVSLVRVEGIERRDGNYTIKVKINDSLIRDDLKIIKDSANADLLSLFNESSVEGEKLAAMYIDHSDKLVDKDIEQLINDVLSDSEIAKDILLIADLDVATQMFAKYSKYLKQIDQNQLLMKKKELLTKVLSPYCAQILTSLNNYFINDTLYMNKGQPYQFTEKKAITLAKVVEEQGLSVPSRTRDRLTFCYDDTNDVLLISYQMGKDLFLVLNKSEAITMTAEKYAKEFSFEDNGEADYVKDLSTWDEISDQIESYFQTDQVFIRYMKADKKYAFIIASSNYSYQNFGVFALEKKDGTWTIIEENIASLKHLNKKHPQFNIQLATEEIQTIEMHNLGNEMLEVILDDLINKGLINSKEGHTIDYCSYGDKYIDFLLSDGKEYVYLVYSMYLHTVYDKETALKTWKDIPDIITLQEIPSI